MAVNDKFSAQQMIDALQQTKGMVTLAARQLKCAPNTVRRYIREYTTVAAAATQANDLTGDTVELALYDEAVNKRNIAALIFLAKTKFKDRGYVERMEIDVRYVALIKQMEVAAGKAGIDLSDALNDFYAELSAASVAAHVSEGADGE